MRRPRGHVYKAAFCAPLLHVIRLPRGGVRAPRHTQNWQRFSVPAARCARLSVRRGRRPAVERSGTNSLGVRRPVCAAVPRCEAPSGRGLSAQPTGGEKTVWNLSLRQRFALPPPSQREARGIRIPLRGGTHGSRPTGTGGVRADRVVRPYDGTSHPKGICSAAGRYPLRVQPQHQPAKSRPWAVLFYAAHLQL